MLPVKTSITIPQDVLAQAKEASDNFSSVVTQALKEYFRKRAVKKAIDSFGSWEKRDENSNEIVIKSGPQETGDRLPLRQIRKGVIKRK